MKITEERVVKITAVDWSYTDDAEGYSLHVEDQFLPIRGEAYGRVIEESDDHIAIAMEIFEGEDVRKVESFPKSAIIEIVEFTRKPVKKAKKK